MACVICGSEKRSKPLLVDFNCGGFDNSHLYEKLNVVSCSNCGHVSNVLTEEQVKGLWTYYSEEYSLCNTTSPNKQGDIPGNNSLHSLKRYGELYDVIRHDIKKDSKILDVGCAMGGFLSSLTSECDNLYGLEPSEKFVEVAKTRVHNADNILCGVAEKLPFESNMFDILVIDQVVEHLIDPNLFFAEANRVIKDGGILCVSLPDASQYEDNNFFDYYFLLIREHIQHFGPSQLKAIGRKHGFSLVNYKTTFPFILGNVGVLPNLTMKFVKTNKQVDWRTDLERRGTDLFLSVGRYVHDSNVMLLKRREYIKGLKDIKRLCAYGISREFNYLLKNAGLAECNLYKLFDDTSAKQNMTINKMPVLSSKEVTDDDGAILITAFAHTDILSKNLRDLNFKGTILIDKE